MTHRNAAGTQLPCWVGLAIVMIAIAPLTAAAQAPGPSERGDQLVSVFAGSLSSGLEDESAGAEQELEDATTFGGSYRYMLTPRLSIGASVEYASTSADAEGPDNGTDGEGEETGDDGEDDDGAGVKVLYVTGGLNFNLRRGGRFVPFVSAGGGLVSLNVSGAGSESAPTGVFGAGFLLAVTNRLVVRADVRDYVYSASKLSTSLRTLMFPDTVSGVVNDLSLTAGVSWRF